MNSAILPGVPNTHPGSFRLFRIAGIDVFLHWSWLLVAYIFFQWRPLAADPKWHILTYLSLFGIVLLHEFGHALACRSVGGTARTIVLWPLGGIAFVNPPPRPGAVLWSIAAGPLVNVLLVPVTIALAIWADVPADPELAATDFEKYVLMLTAINIGLLVFNMLPIYPLDGGQIVQAILWFFMGRARSLRITAWFGLICAAAGVIYALSQRDTWLVILGLFIGWRAWAGVQIARWLAEHEAREASAGALAEGPVLEDDRGHRSKIIDP